MISSGVWENFLFGLSKIRFIPFVSFVVIIMTGAKCLRIKGTLFLFVDFHFFLVEIDIYLKLKLCVSNAPFVNDFTVVGQYTSYGIKFFFFKIYTYHVPLSFNHDLHLYCLKLLELIFNKYLEKEGERNNVEGGYRNSQRPSVFPSVRPSKKKVLSQPQFFTDTY